MSSGCAFVRYQYICSALFGFVTKHVCDKQTDRQNYDSQERASIRYCAIAAGVVIICGPFYAVVHYINSLYRPRTLSTKYRPNTGTYVAKLFIVIQNYVNAQHGETAQRSVLCV